MDHRLQAARDGAIVLALTALVVYYQAQQEAGQKLLPGDVTLTSPVVPGTSQLQLLVRGAGCDQPKSAQKRGYKKPKKRVKGPTTQFDDTAKTIVITVRVEDPGPYACVGEDPGVPRTVTLAVPVGDRRILDGTRNPPVPMRTGPPRTLPFDTILPAPSATPSPP